MCRPFASGQVPPNEGDGIEGFGVDTVSTHPPQIHLARSGPLPQAAVLIAWGKPCFPHEPPSLCSRSTQSVGLSPGKARLRPRDRPAPEYRLEDRRGSRSGARGLASMALPRKETSIWPADRYASIRCKQRGRCAAAGRFFGRRPGSNPRRHGEGGGSSGEPSAPLRQNAVALFLEGVGVVVVAVALPEAGLVGRGELDRRAATWRSSRSTCPGRPGGAASRARASAARRRRASRARRPSSVEERERARSP